MKNDKLWQKMKLHLLTIWSRFIRTYSSAFNISVNCRKDGPTLRNKQHFETRLKELEETYNAFQSNHEVICIKDEYCDHFEKLHLEAHAFLLAEY